MRRRALVLALGVFISYAYFYQAGGWNQNTRFDLVRAVTERRSIQIDAYQGNTGDKARFDGHYYADKAPGASFVAVPAVTAVRLFGRAAGLAMDTPAALGLLSYVATLAASALPAVTAVVLLFLFARRLGYSEAAAGVTSIAYGLGSPFWAYGTLLFGHALAAACLATAWLSADLLRDSPLLTAGDRLLGFAVGMACGWAVVTEYPSAIGATVLAALAIANARQSGARGTFRVNTGIAIGAGTCAIVLGWYLWSAFGSPYHLSYASEENTDLLKHGFFGITVPKLWVVRELLWGWYRGLVPTSPVVVFAPVGWWLLWRRTAVSRTIGAGLLIAFLILMLNAAYDHWEGGWSYGPRHLTPVLGFLYIGIAPVWDASRRWGRAAILVCAMIGVGCSLVAVSTTPQPPVYYDRPMQERLWPAFKAGEMAINTQTFSDFVPPAGKVARHGPGAAWNLGEKAGLHGVMSLVPLLVVWSLAAWTWRRAS